ncbi:hypothetical protein J5H61_20275, partial [Pseudomonas asiatica]|nr:hypothetical protein [Pseudomonas asiatica]
MDHDPFVRTTELAKPLLVLPAPELYLRRWRRNNMRKTLVAVFACALAFGATAMLPADISPMGSAYAKGGG